MLMICLSLVDTPEEKSKFRQLYEKYQGLMFYCAREILRDIRLAKHLKKINDIDCNKTKHFIVIIVESASKDICRREKKQMAVSWEEIEGSLYFPARERVEEMSGLTGVEQAIMELPLTYREIFCMRYVWGYSNQEIGKILGIRQGALRQRIVRGKLLLQKILDEMEVDACG